MERFFSPAQEAVTGPVHLLWATDEWVVNVSERTGWVMEVM